MTSKFVIGSRVKDEISLVSGTIDQVLFAFGREPEYRILRPGVDCDGRIWEPVWFTESRLHNDGQA